MGKYLQVIEARYPGAPFGHGSDAPHRIAEAVTAYAYAIQHGKIGTNGTSKVILESGDERRVEDLIDVLRYRHPLGMHGDVNALPEPHERYLGEVHNALRELGGDRGWDLSALDAAYERVRDAAYRFAGTWKKPKWNGGRSVAVGVGWKTTDRLELGFTLSPKGEATDWVVFLTSPIGLGLLEGALGSLSWEDDRHAVLSHANKRDRWRLDTETRSIEFLYGPAQDGNPQGAYALGKMYLDGDLWVEQDREKALFWLRKSADAGFGRAARLLASL